MYGLGVFFERIYYKVINLVGFLEWFLIRIIDFE